MMATPKFDFLDLEIVNMDVEDKQKFNLILTIITIHRYLYKPPCQGPHTNPTNILAQITIPFIITPGLESPRDEKILKDLVMVVCVQHNR